MMRCGYSHREGNDDLVLSDVPHTLRAMKCLCDGHSGMFRTGQCRSGHSLHKKQGGTAVDSVPDCCVGR